MRVDAERDADTEHGEAVREVHGAVEGVDDPGRGVGDEVFLRGASGVGLFADEGVCGVGALDGGVDECFDICDVERKIVTCCS
jgi:hypothetical protein